MSKKIAAGADAIVLDVKTGAGAFMKTIEESKELAQAMVNIGNQVGRRTMAVISDMSQPLGRAIGNALEVQEAIDTLRGEGPEDLTELCLILGSQMVLLANKASSLEEAKQMLQEAITSGRALDKFKQFIINQGGDASVVDDKERLPQAQFIVEVPAKTAGYVTEIVADELGTAAMWLGAGRATKDSEIDLAVGLMLDKKVGDRVEEGETLVTIHTNKIDIDHVIEKIYDNITIGEHAEAPVLIYDVITN